MGRHASWLFVSSRRLPPLSPVLLFLVLGVSFGLSAAGSSTMSLVTTPAPAWILVVVVRMEGWSAAGLGTMGRQPVWNGEEKRKKKRN